MAEPADKKRKIDDDDWDDDDDFAFTQEQLNDLDMVTMSQISSHKESSSSSSCSRSRSTFQIGTGHQFVKPKVNNSSAKASLSLNKRELKSPFENTDSNHVKVNSPTSFNESSSSKFPSNNKDISQADSPNNFNKSLITKNETLQGQVSKYKTEIQKIRDLKMSQDGQITLLNQKLVRMEGDLNNLRQEKCDMFDKLNQENSDSQSKLTKEINRLKSELQFKNQDLLELQGTCRRLEVQKNKSMTVNFSQDCSQAVSKKEEHSFHNFSQSTRRNNFPSVKKFLDKGEISPKKPKPIDEISVRRKSKCEVSDKRRKAPLIDPPNGNLNGANIVVKMLAPLEIDDSISQKSKKRLTKKSFVQGIISLLQPPLHPSLYASALENLPGFIPFERNSPLKGHASSSSSSHSSLSSHFLPSFSVGALSHENMNLCKHALLALLQNNKLNDCNHEQFLQSHSECAILFLPLLEETISLYIDNLISSATGSGDPSYQSNTDESSSGSLDLFLSDKQSDVNKHHRIETFVRTALELLLILIDCSSHVRQAITWNRSSFSIKQDGNNNSSNNKTDQSKTTAENASSSKVDVSKNASFFQTGSMPNHIDIIVNRIIRNSELFERIIQTCNPILPNNKVADIRIVEISFHIIISLVKGTTSSSLIRFDALFRQEIFINCFNHDQLPIDCCHRFHIIALEALCDLMKNTGIVKQLCSKTDDCLLLHIYKVNIISHAEASVDEISLIRHKTLTFLDLLLSAERTNLKSVLETDCLCSAEMMKYIVLLLNQELHVYDRYGCNLHVLRQGVSIMLAIVKYCPARLCFQKYFSIEGAYVELIVALTKIFQGNPNIISDKELDNLHYLWYFDSPCPGVSDEDDDDKNSSSIDY